VDARDPRLTLGRFLADLSARHRDRDAVRFEGRALRYRDLEAEARALAKGLVGAGVVKGARVGIQLGNRPEWIVAALAVGMLGGVVVPVNTFASREEFATILRHGDVSTLLMQGSLLRHRFLDDLLAEHPEILRRRQRRRTRASNRACERASRPPPSRPCCRRAPPPARRRG
jgi:fatty-acyl-CoA synthase